MPDPNAKPNIKLQASDSIKKIYEDFLELQNQFKRLMATDTDKEKRDRAKDEKNLDKLINKLNKA